MRTELRKIIAPALQACAVLVAISLTTLEAASAQPVPTTFTRITTGAIATAPGYSENRGLG